VTERENPGSGEAAPAAADGPASVRDAGIDGRLAIVLAFFGSACLLILEIVAGRLLAPTLGVSLYTWTSVIGVVLAGVSLGNYLGGRLGDRRPSRSTVAVIYVAGSLASLAVLLLVRVVDSLQLPSGAPALLQVVWLTAILFFVPATVISAATPVLTRLSLHSVSEGGRVVGRIQAGAALGSILGTFLTGFVLISALGTRRVVAGVAVTLLILAIVARPPWLRGRVVELASLMVAIVAVGWASTSECTRESNYFCIKVKEVKVGVRTESGLAPAAGDFRAIYLDRLLHAVVDLSDPTALYYPYEQTYAQALAAVKQPGSTIDALLLGGGGFVFPRYVQATYRGGIDVVEIDPAVVRVARSHLGLADSSRMRIHEEDARRFLAAVPAHRSFDVVLGDTFNDYSVPFQLATREFNDLLARQLKEDGLYVMNVVDAERNDFLRSVVRTLRETFPFVTVLRSPGTWPPDASRQTTVVVAAKRPPSRSLPGAVAGPELDAFVAGGHSVALTDDHVPVEQLLAPVVRQNLADRRSRS
jgi:spermidine synthase